MGLLDEARTRREQPSDRSGGLLAELRAKQEPLSEPSAEQTIEEAPTPVAPEKMGGFAGEVTEGIAGFNRAMFNMADFLGIDNVNALLELSGSDYRLPTTQQMFGAPRGSFGSDISASAGEAAGMAVTAQDTLRNLAARLPQNLASAPSRVLTSAASESIPSAVGLGAVSGAGAEFGEDVTDSEVGALVGGVLAPITASGVTSLLSAGGRGLASFINSTSGMSDDAAAELLATAMVREGLGPDDVAKRLSELGPEAVPADVGNSFSRLLRLASNKVPQIEGRARQVLDERQLGQSDRILAAMDDASGTSSLSLGDEIARLNSATKGEIDDLYKTARETPFEMTGKVGELLTGKSAAGLAQRKVARRLANKEAAGDEITNLDIIDATKQELDDQIGRAIRQGESNTARDLVRVKNVLVEEVDQAVPEYKQARDLFAGKAQLENAGSIGQDFFKIKASEMPDLVKTMSASERRMFILGAKQAIVDKVDAMGATADSVKRLFGKTGDIKKLRSLFDTDDQFNQFRDALEREAQFVLTRRAAQANSTTAQQQFDEVDAVQILDEARRAATDPIEAASYIGRVMAKLKSAKGSQENIEALEEAGDFLLATGVKPERIAEILRRGTSNQIRSALERASKREISKRAKAIGGGAPVAAGVLTDIPGETQE